MADEKKHPKGPRVNVGYAFAQLAKALTGAGETATKRLRQWQQVIEGLVEGTLDVGSRTPVRDTPAWVTLEVAHGGFATGSHAAGGPLEPHELAKLTSLGEVPQSKQRATLNLHYAGPAGRSELGEMLRDGRYRVNVPEEAALLVVAWLVAHGETERADELLQTLMPYFDGLRFFPVPAPRPARMGVGVSVQTVGDCVARLHEKQPHTPTLRMKEAIEVWAPLYDRAVALFLETVEGEMPTLLLAELGERSGPAGNGVVRGGWPCKRYPEGWKTRAQALLDAYVAARMQHHACGKPERPKENFARLRGYLERCVRDPASLTGRDVGAIRKILASYVTRRGAPGSERLLATRADQRQSVTRPAHHLVARVLGKRLADQPSDEGLLDPAPFVGPLAADEALPIGATPGEPVPKPLARKIERCLEAPLATLVERGLISSAEVMARLVPALTALARAGAIDDVALKRVYTAVYAAFRRRRSLLLLDLESQVRFDELPWVSAISPWVGAGIGHRAAARATLVEVASMAVAKFPYTILPNPLVKELRALAASAGEPSPFVEELAADIFMGAFSESFLRAAQAAGRLLKGSLYERYYGLSYARVLGLDDVKKDRFTAPTSAGFAALCSELAGGVSPSSVAANGLVIEQSQILTTHNLALLFDKFGLRIAMRATLPELARRCFDWVCARQQTKSTAWRAQMQMTKNTAYAWRQMLFFLSLGTAAEVRAFLAWAAERLEQCRPDFRTRFAPVMTGLQIIAGGGAFGPDGLAGATGGRRFLGWSVGPHWLLARGDSSPEGDS